MVEFHFYPVESSKSNHEVWGVATLQQGGPDATEEGRFESEPMYVSVTLP
jgi:hypothetical protein